jgi:hypothetical protein
LMQSRASPLPRGLRKEKIKRTKWHKKLNKYYCSGIKNLGIVCFVFQENRHPNGHTLKGIA